MVESNINKLKFKKSNKLLSEPLTTLFDRHNLEKKKTMKTKLSRSSK